jgi:hypothetical protein
VVSDRLIDVFPPDDSVALFMVVMAAAATDVDQADLYARHANAQDDDGDPHRSDRLRFTYWVRRTLAHLFEGIAAFKHWKQHDVEVRNLLASLSPDGRKRLSKLEGIEQKIGKGGLKAVRHRSSHYPSPGTRWEDSDPVGDLADAVRLNPDTRAGFDLALPTAPDGQKPLRSRRVYRFGDQMMLSMALGDFDPKKAESQFEQIDEAAEAFCDVINEVFDLYCKRRGLCLTEQQD